MKMFKYDERIIGLKKCLTGKILKLFKFLSKRNETFDTKNKIMKVRIVLKTKNKNNSLVV
jgi:hypothetical protein